MESSVQKNLFISNISSLCAKYSNFIISRLQSQIPLPDWDKKGTFPETDRKGGCEFCPQPANIVRPIRAYPGTP